MSPQKLDYTSSSLSSSSSSS